MIPDLDAQFLAPAGWQWGEFSRGERRLRFGYSWPEVGPNDAKGVIVMLPGLNDFCEKSFETAHWALNNDYAFFVLDWVNQGKSTRLLPNPHKRHSEGFEEDLQDFHEWLTNHILPETKDAPMIMLAHSMGGNIGMRYLLQNSDVFKCAVFSAPMFGVKALRFVPGPVVATANKFLANSYVPGGTDFHVRHHLPPALSILTKDPVRNGIDNAWMLADSDLQVGAVTYGWVYEAHQSCQKLRDSDLSTIQIPCLIGTAEHEMLVDNAATQRIAAKLPHHEIIALKDSYHEPLMERDFIRNSFLNKIQAFIEESLNRSQ